MSSSFETQVALVVGAGSGIGRAVAKMLASRGASVACVDRDEPSAEAVATEIRDCGSKAEALAADVVQPATVHAAVARTVGRFGQISILINTAGVAGPTGVQAHEFDLDQFDAVLAVNLKGALVVTQAVVPGMLEARYGRIAHLASVAGKDGNPGMAAYTASKAGLIGLVKALGKEYARTGITVNALAPAFIRTPMHKDVPESVINYMVERIPMGRGGTVEEAAEALCWMVSPACSFTTGFVFDLSGGRATY